MMQPSGMAQRRSFLVMDKVRLMEPPAIRPKMKMMEQKIFLKLSKMCSGSMMTTSTHGIREGSKEDQPDKAKAKAREKEKAEEAEDSSGQDEKEKAKAEEKAALTWWEKKDMKMNGNKKKNGMIMTAIGPKNKNGTMPIGAQKNCTTRMSMVCSRERKRQER